jgi:malate dehydrogenase (oxaloacetate-decarboxylating)(NADP+)
LGVIASQASLVTEGMFLAAAETPAGQVSRADYEGGRLYPPLNTIRQISLSIAIAVAELAFEEGLARVERPENLTAFIQSQMFEPQYSSYV